MFYLATSAIVTVLTVSLLPFSVSAQAHEGNHKIGQREVNSEQQLYRDFWPKTISLTLMCRDGQQKVVQIKGAAYWNTLSASTRTRLNTFNKLYCYCQLHEGDRGY